AGNNSVGCWQSRCGRPGGEREAGVQFDLRDGGTHRDRWSGFHVDPKNGNQRGSFGVFGSVSGRQRAFGRGAGETTQRAVDGTDCSNTPGPRALSGYVEKAGGSVRSALNRE